MLRPAGDGSGGEGLEALLTQRASSLRFGADVWVFPGGRVDPEDADHQATAVRETAEETGIEVEPGSLVPLTRWVTPAGLPSRFDARFFAAIAPAGTEARAASPEVAAWRWLGPAAALEAHGRGELAMWLPTYVTLQQLAGLRTAADVAAAFATGSASGVRVGLEIDGRRRLEQPWAGGVEGRPGRGWIVGRRAWVVVDPADPTGQTADAIERAAAAAGARLAGVVVRDLQPERHAGVEMFAAGLGLPVAGGGGASVAPYPVAELHDGQSVPFGDVPLVARSRRASGWPGAVAFEDPAGILED